MATVTLRPGDTLNLTMPSGVKRGKLEYELVAPFMYEDIVELLTPRQKRKNASTPGGRISRQINLFCSALEKGIWTTGAPINRHLIASKLTDLLAETDATQLSEKAVLALRKLKTFEGGLGAYLTTNLNAVLDKVQ